ncbi:TPA: putative lipid II flippase FtsW [Candidatus Taylorbacteria bacterium]|nr:putative lipid II flippase FtsW [Candidatus Taylorbacteria bacterium]
MAITKGKSDRIFLLVTLLLIAVGFFVFSSASLGLVAREGANFATVALKQAAVAVFGIVIMIVMSNIDVRNFRKMAPYIFLSSLVLTALVFVPHIGFAHGGATRWLSFGPYTFQPAEFLKIAAVIFLAALLSGYKDKLLQSWRSLIPFFIILISVGVLMLKQPDTGTFLVIFLALLTIYIASGARLAYVGIIFLCCIVAVAGLAYFRPYVAARFTTFLNPSADSQGSGYQIQQALIAVGSGGVTGRGFGQSIQKFSFLPEPIGDSIFAVAAEEFGFVGAAGIVIIFVFFALRGLKIAASSKDNFGRLLAIGIVTLIAAQAMINIAAIIGVMPLTGIPLSFISHGGTALMFTMAEAGMILNISKTQRKVS